MSNPISLDCPKCELQMISVCTDATVGFKEYEFYCPECNHTEYPALGQICIRMLVNIKWSQLNKDQKRAYIKSRGFTRKPNYQIDVYGKARSL